MAGWRIGCGAVSGRRRALPARGLLVLVLAGAPLSRAAAQTPEMSAGELWARAVEAHGGRETLQQVRTRRTVAEVVMQTPQEVLRGTVTTSIEYPERIQRYYSVGDQRFSHTLAGEDLWILNLRGHQLTLMRGVLARRPSARQGAQMKMLLQSDPVLFLRGGEGWERRSVEPDGEMPGLEARTPEGDVYRAYFHPGTLLLQKLELESSYGGESTTKYSDYRAVDGLTVPFRVETWTGGLRALEETLSQAERNVSLADGIFDMPEMEE